MPRMNGYEAAAELRKRGFKRPLIAMTAGVLADEQKQCWKAGFDDILPKPFKRPDIEAMLNKWTKEEIVLTSEEKNQRLEALSKGTESKGTDADEVFSKALLLDAFLNNEESAKSLLGRFIDRTSELLEGLPALMTEQKWEDAFRSVHTIRGSAMTLSGMELGKAAARLEMIYKQADTAAMETAFDSILKAFKRFKTEAENYIQS